MGDRLQGKVAIVTGSGRGIGREIALNLASQGAKVVVNDLGVAADGTGISQNVADEVVAEIKKAGGEACANCDSVTESSGAGNIIKTAIDSYGRLDILVNNAGFLRDRMLWNMTDEEWDAVIKVHLYGHFYCTRAAAGYMRQSVKDGKQQSGRIINVTSEAGIYGNPPQPNYSAAKSGIIGFSYACARALGRLGITCNVIAPRASTRMTDTIPEEVLRERAKAKGIIGADTMPFDELRIKYIGGAPQAVAPLISWLASDLSQSVNGLVFLVAQGRVGVFNHMEEMRFTCKDGMFSIEELENVMPTLTDKEKMPSFGAE